MTTTLCSDCSVPPKGEAGHGNLAFQVEGPFPGHRIFRCGACGERWIRHYGFIDDKHAWTRYDLQFVVRRPLPDNERPSTFRRIGA